MPANKCSFFLESDFLAIFARENPGIADGGAADHHAIASGEFFDMVDVSDGFHVSVAKHGNFDRLFDFTNRAPIGRTLIRLRFGATMYGKQGGTTIFENFGDVEIIAVVTIPA